jgi:hypothetical protein
MSSEKQGAETRTPPYMSYARFEGFVGSLHGKPLPPRIDRSLMNRMSGGDQSQVRIALRFLGLTTGEENLVTDRFRELVASYASPATPEWKANLAAVISQAYRPMTSDLDDAATQAQLDERFREKGGLAGSSLLKAVRFYLSAMSAAGLSVSPHFKGSASPAVPSNGQTKRQPRKPRENSGETPSKLDAPPPAGVDEIVVPLPGRSAKVWLPADISQAEFDFVLTTLKALRKLRGPTG